MPATVTLVIEAEPFETLNDADMMRHLLPSEARMLAAALNHFADRAELL
jgi:hypothetical protein